MNRKGDRYGVVELIDFMCKKVPNCRSKNKTGKNPGKGNSSGKEKVAPE